ncbi:AAA family ATPase [Heliobacterium chlorum]|uniref:endopeptidase La n=1 Tax=Heliobacterium chlorum TaxID=2698 RepID=A0ABR7T039_HELCL|nr:AAA family ATPase [Heliobacterium chlorum]
MTKTKAIPDALLKSRRLEPGQLRTDYDPVLFSFTSTDEITAMEDGIIGQPRAVKAMDFGLSAKHPGFHIFITGPVGSGKTSFAVTKVKSVAQGNATPPDICFVNHFDQPDRPIVLLLSPGLGSELRRDTIELVKELQTEIHKALESEEYEKSRTAYLRQVETKLTALFKEMEDMAQAEGFTLQKGQSGIFTVPLNEEGKGMSKEEFEALEDEQRQDISDREHKLESRLGEILRRSRALQKEAAHQLKEIERETAEYASNDLMEAVREKYKDYPKVLSYFAKVREEVMESVTESKEESSGEETIPASLMGLLKQQKRAISNRYEVNLFVENASQIGAPVVVESNPTFTNLFGKVEYRSSFGSLATDFTMIKPGSLHQANGGYLIVQALPLLTSPGAWEGLKRVLKTRELRIENLGEQLGLPSTATLKPEPVPIDVKVILIGSPRIYHLLYEADEDFRKFFKVRVDFDSAMERNESNISKYAAFIRSVCQRENLLPFTAQAVGAVVDYSSRLVAHQRKLSTSFHDIKDIVVESALWAQNQAAEAVDEAHVEQAIEEKEFRVNRIEERVQEAMQEGTLLVDTEGSVVGQVNGLAVLGLSDHAFGKPSRITARVYLGREGVVNIEREIRMSGLSHSKGVLILSSFFSSRFAQDHPLSLSATLTFEQLYEGVDGDSASSTELYALLSAITGLPIRQEIAVTGSVNQRGEIQPIGGVNEKVEGFFRLCEARGLTGKQGVIIPVQNVPNLMLAKDVVEAVRKEQFHIYAVKHVDEGIEILTSVVAGERGANGNYPAGTINYMVAEKLRLMEEKWQAAAKPPRASRKTAATTQKSRTSGKTKL